MRGDSKIRIKKELWQLAASSSPLAASSPSLQTDAMAHELPARSTKGTKRKRTSSAAGATTVNILEEWTCPHCSTSFRSVLESTARRWETEGCSYLCFGRRLRSYQDIEADLLNIWPVPADNIQNQQRAANLLRELLRVDTDQNRACTGRD
eukprot:SAG31_NODE_4257_length_3414_cov_1.764706_5_plen_151_part_00